MSEPVVTAPSKGVEMAYFSNGSEGESYLSGWCLRCRNWKDRPDIPQVGEGCPIWDAHLLYQVVANEGCHPMEQQCHDILELFIPTEPDKKSGLRIWPGMCTLFEPIEQGG